MDKLNFYFPYSTLSNKFKDIIILHSYYDIVYPGKDDRANDYFELFYNGDNYLKATIEKGLTEMDREYTSEAFRTIINAHSDPNSTARYPRTAYIFSSNLFQLRLWLLEIAVKNYNETDHLNYLSQSEEFKQNAQFLKSADIKFTSEHNSYHSYHTVDYEFNNEGFLSKNKLNFIIDKIDNQLVRTLIKHIELSKVKN